MVLFDNNFLSYLLCPDARPPIDIDTSKPVAHAQERIQHLIESLEQSQSRILIPSPVLAEVLVFSGDALDEWLNTINTSSVFEVADFDQRAAIELALMEQAIRKQGDKRANQEGAWAKVKFDRQIVAIAKVHQVSCLYTDDHGMKSWAEQHGITVKQLRDVDLPPQQDLPLKS
jgi:predicted nucleic acid-binding protein